MKKSLTLALFATLSPCLFANVIITNCHLQYGGYRSGEHIFDGPTLCTKGKSPGVTVRGPLNATGTVFTDKVLVDGPVTVNKVTFTDLSVRGPAYLQQVQAQNLDIKGPLFAQRSQLGVIKAYSHSTRLDQSQAKSITIETDKTNTKAPVVKLQGKTTVFGDITFMGHAGEVKKSAKAVIKGKVVNGKIVN